MAEGDKDTERRRGRRFKRICQGVLLASLLASVVRTGCSAKHYLDYISSLGAQGVQQKLVERSFEDESLLEKQLKMPDKIEQDTAHSLADFLKEGESAQDFKNYVPQKSNERPQQADAQGLLLSAKEFRFKIDPPKQDPGINSADQGGPEKYLNPNTQEEKGHQFELRKADSDKTLAFSRETSYIVPRGKLDYGSKAKEKRPEKKLEVIRDNKAIIAIDTSGSMCSNPDNYQQKTFNGNKYTVYLPSAFGLSIADYYVHDRNTCVIGFTFSSTSQATSCTQNMATLANLYAQLQCDGTVIDYRLLEEKLKGSNSAVDVYIITDADILSEQQMRQNIAELQRIMGSGELNRVFFIEWRTGQQGYNPRKDQIIKETGMPNAYYSKITKLEDMEAVVRTLNEKLKQQP